MDNNKKIKVIHRKIYHEDKQSKQNTFKLLSHNIGETIKIKIKEGYEEIQEPGIATINTITANEVKVLNMDEDWVHIEIYGEKKAQKFIRIESIASIEAE